MNHSKLRKPRHCNACDRELHVTAKELHEHAVLCARVKAIGLEFPSIVAPKTGDLVK